MGPALSVVVSVALGATVSSSRFGVAVNGSSAAAASVIAGCPRAVDAAQPLTGPAAEPVLANYRQQCTGGAEIIELPDVLLNQLPSAALSPALLTLAQGQSDAGAYWGFVQSPTFSGVTKTSLKWVSGPANLFVLLSPSINGWADYMNGFVGQLATLVRQRAAADGATYSLVVPPWTPNLPAPDTAGFCAAVSAARLADPGIAWAWAATTSLPLTVTDEIATTFGYRAVRTTCALQGVPIFSNVTASGGWLTSHTPTEVVTWMRAVDQAVAVDADIVANGAILLRSFGSGGPDDLSGAATEIATFLKTPSQGGGGDGTSSGGVNNGTNPGGTGGGALGPTAGHEGGCGNPADGLALLAVAALAPLVLRRRGR